MLAFFFWQLQQNFFFPCCWTLSKEREKEKKKAFTVFPKKKLSQSTRWIKKSSAMRVLSREVESREVPQVLSKKIRWSTLVFFSTERKRETGNDPPPCFKNSTKEQEEEERRRMSIRRCDVWMSDPTLPEVRLKQEKVGNFVFVWSGPNLKSLRSRREKGLNW